MDEDDGQIARELVPVDEAFMRKDEDDEGTGPALGLEQKCNKAFSTAFKRWLVLWERDWFMNAMIKQQSVQVFIK